MDYLTPKAQIAELSKRTRNFDNVVDLIHRITGITYDTCGNCGIITTIIHPDKEKKTSVCQTFTKVPGLWQLGEVCLDCKNEADRDVNYGTIVG